MGEDPSTAADVDAQSMVLLAKVVTAERKSRWPAIEHWPYMLMLPASLMFYAMDRQIGVAAGGQGTYEAFDTRIRWGGSGGLQGFWFASCIGTLIWLAASVLVLMRFTEQRKIKLAPIAYLLLGALSHPWVLVWVLDAIFGAPELTYQSDAGA